MEHYQKKILKFLIFDSSQGLLAVDIANILEVIKNPILSPIPKNFSYVEGLINFRGNIVTVIDLLNKLYNINAQFNIDFCVLILKSEIQNEKMIIGIKINGVKDVVSLTEDKIKMVQDYGKNYNPDYYNGVISYKEQQILLLKTEVIFLIETLKF